MSTAARLLYAAAGSPEIGRPLPTPSRCWWCGLDCTRGVALGEMPDTFVEAVQLKAARCGGYICAPCAWTLSDWVRLPVELGLVQLQKAIANDGRIEVGERANALRLPDGRLGVWPRKQEAQFARQGTATPGMMWACSEVELAGRITGKFRNYDHFGWEGGGWHPFKAVQPAARAWLRWALLNPPPGRWCLSLGDGQKHEVIHTPVSDGRDEVQVISMDNVIVPFTARSIGYWIAAVEELRRLGVWDSQIERGEFIAPQLSVAAQVRAHGEVLRPIVGSPRLDLAMRISRTKKEIENGHADPTGPTWTADSATAPAELAEPVAGLLAPDAHGPDASSPGSGLPERPGRGGPEVGAGPVDAVQPAQPAPRQLTLWGR